MLLQSLQSFTTVDPAMSAIISLVAAEPMSNAARHRRSVMARASQRVAKGMGCEVGSENLIKCQMLRFCVVYSSGV